MLQAQGINLSTSAVLSRATFLFIQHLYPCTEDVACCARHWRCVHSICSNAQGARIKNALEKNSIVQRLESSASVLTAESSPGNVCLERSRENRLAIFA